MSLTKNILATGLALALVLGLFRTFEIDLSVQNLFYDADLHQWLLDRNDAWLHFILYSGIKKLFLLFVLAVLITLGLSFSGKYPPLHEYRRGLIIVLASCILVPLSANILKVATNTPCPKDITQFNGNSPYITVFDILPAGFAPVQRARCFPAGHASGGFSLLSLFFLFKQRRNRKAALLTALTLGWMIGLYKMLIGDHFLSHTLVSMILAWLITLLMAGGVFRAKPDAG